MAFKLNGSIVVFLILFLTYNINFKDSSSGDNIGPKYLPVRLLTHFDFDLTEYRRLYDVFGHGLVEMEGRWFSSFPPEMAFLALPFYAPFVILGLTSRDVFIHIAGKLATSTLTALAGVFVYSTMRRYLPSRDAFVMSLIWGLGTLAFGLLSQDMWQHTGSQLFLCAFIYYILTSLENPGNLRFAGLALGIAASVRYSVLVLIPPYILYVLFVHRRGIIPFTSYLALPIVVMLSLNVLLYGSIFGAFVRLTSPTEWGLNPKYFVGLLFSPSRGLFVYSPFLLFGLGGIIRKIREKDVLHMAFASSILLNTLFFSLFQSGALGGHTFGPRLMSETVPFFMVFLAIQYERIMSSKSLRVLFAAAVLFSVFVEVIGAFSYDGSWNMGGNVGCAIQNCEDRIWSVTDSQILYYVQNPRVHIYYWMFNLTKS